MEWPTVLVGLGCYTGILAATAKVDVLGYGVAALLLTLALTLFSSLSHEVLHGHPFQTRAWNEALIFPAFGLFIPYGRFRDTHFAHHQDPVLTDPYDDPESHFVDPAVWVGWSLPRRWIYTFNNTLLGRMMIGPVLGSSNFTLRISRRCVKGTD